MMIKVLVDVKVFSELKNDNRALMYRYEQLKHELNWAFSMRINQKEMRLIFKPNTVEDYTKLDQEEEVLLYDISFKHYDDL